MAAQTEQKVSGGLACYCEATFACPCITKIMAEKKLEKLFAAEEEDLKWSRIAQKVGGSAPAVSEAPVEKKEPVSEKEETCPGCEGCYYEATLACPVIRKRLGQDESVCECGEVKSNDGSNTGYFSYCAKCCAEAADEAFLKDMDGEDDGSGWRGE